MLKRMVENVGCNVLTWLRLFVERVFMEVDKKTRTIGKFLKITTNHKFVYSMRSRDKGKTMFENEHLSGGKWKIHRNSDHQFVIHRRMSEGL